MELRREEFVPTAYRSLAFVDMEIPLGHGEVMLAPKMEARILQELQIRKSDRILEVGSGYLTALLAKKGGHVYSIEIVSELKMIAEKSLQDHGIVNGIGRLVFSSKPMERRKDHHSQHKLASE